MNNTRIAYTESVKLCKCGCKRPVPIITETSKKTGEIIGHFRRFINGHNRRKPPLLFTPVHPCACGCGRLVRYRFALGHGNKNKSMPEERKRKIGNGNRGKIRTPEFIKHVTEKNHENGHYKRCSKVMKKNNPMNNPEIIRKAVNKNHQNGHYKESSKRMKKNNPMYNPEVVAKNSGPNNWNWKGGISCEPYCQVWVDKEFKEEIKSRDNYQCQNPDCWKTSNKIMLHHINYIKKDCCPKNLITLCGSCNTRANTNREFWQASYVKIIEQKYV